MDLTREEVVSANKDTISLPPHVPFISNGYISEQCKEVTFKILKVTRAMQSLVRAGITRHGAARAAPEDDLSRVVHLLRYN